MAQEQEGTIDETRKKEVELAANLVAACAGGAAAALLLEALPNDLTPQPLLAAAGGVAAAAASLALGSLVCRRVLRLWWGLLPLPVATFWLLHYNSRADPELGFCVCAPLCCCGRKFTVLALVALWTLWLVLSLCCSPRPEPPPQPTSRDALAWRIATSCLLPAAHVLCGLLPVWGSMRAVGLMGPLDFAGVALALVGLAAGGAAARRLARHGGPGAVLGSGLFALCRHPDYLADVIFWLGQALLGLGATAASETSRTSGGPWSNWWLAAVGFPGFALLTVAAGVPLAERRLGTAVQGYAEYQQKVPALWPTARCCSPGSGGIAATHASDAGAGDRKASEAGE